ncbi:hypothetical protein [Halorubrum tailed virus BLv36]|nr:hypothetical protein [Halorubrum tailed virus BLv36]
MSTNELPEELKGSAELLQEQIQGKELQDVGDIALDDYPEAAQENARMALDAREETGNPNDCLTDTGWAVANNLDSGDPVSQSQLESMSAFERFEEDKDQGEEGRADCGWMAWKAWGGDEGIAWADSKMDELEAARENSAVHNHAHRCGFHLSDVDLSGLEPWEKELSKLHEQIHTADSSKQLAGFTERSLPEFVVERLRGAILNGAIFSDIESVGANDLSGFRTFMAESLTEDGWTIDELTGELQEFQPDISDSRAESVIRTEAGNVIREAREDGYAENFDLDKERFYWVGSLDPDRTTLACQWLIAGDSQVSGTGFDTMGNFSGTNPNEGGEPVSLSRLKELIQEANKRDPELDHDARELTPHINCRKQWVRYVE